MPTWLDAEPDPSPRAPIDPMRGFFDDEDESDEDDAVPRRRFAIAPPAAIALIAVGVIACAVAAFGLFRGSETAPVVDFGAVGATSTVAVPGVPESAPAGAPSSHVPETPAEVVVSVVGLVHKPGLVRLAPGSRVAEAIDRAGGARKGADLLTLNLAQVVRDGDQVLVGYAGGEGQMSLRSAVVGAADAPPAAGPSANPSAPQSSAGGAATTSTPPGASAKVNLNTATEAELDELPGIGPVTAQAILDWRNRNGRFVSVDQLAEVDGIGPARLAKLRDLVTV